MYLYTYVCPGVRVCLCVCVPTHTGCRLGSVSTNIFCSCVLKLRGIFEIIKNTMRGRRFLFIVTSPDYDYQKKKHPDGFWKQNAFWKS